MKLWMLAAILTLCGAMTLQACANDDSPVKNEDVTAIADKVWAFSQSHPDGFTLDIHSMTCPTEGIAVSYAATQDSHSRDQLESVVSHALQHDGYVGGWYNSDNGLYYFDSTRLFPEDALAAAIQFGKENGQHSVFILSTSTDIPLAGKVAQIAERGTLLVGTTGDYRPLSYWEADGNYWGFGIEVAGKIAERLGVRRETMLMSDGYLCNGKTILCRASEADRYRSLADVDRPEVRVMVNPGGLNEKFALANLTQAQIIVHERNEEIPSLVAEGQADVMITEITEAPWYVQNDARPSAPLLSSPFTHGESGVLMRKGQDDLLALVNAVIAQMKADGSLRGLHEKYGLVYGY